MAGDVEVRLARVGDPAVADADRVAVGAIARTAVGDDQHTPGPVEGGLGTRGRGRSSNGGNGRNSSSHANQCDQGRACHLSLMCLDKRSFISVTTAPGGEMRLPG